MLNRRFAIAVALLVACAAPPPPKIVPQQAVNALTSVTSVTKTIAEPRIRVGMLSDQTSLTFPRIDGGYYLVTDSGASILRRGFTDTAPLPESTPHYAVQAAALSDAASANVLAEKLRASTGQRVEVVVSDGLNRVLVGDFPTSEAATGLRDQIAQSMIVRRPTDQPFSRDHRLVDDEGEREMLSGESILVLPAASDTITINQKPYRTAARILINNRGLLNIINELNLEDYLRGVVPAEMGSKIYDKIEGLKAQAIAERTYAVPNLGQFRSEGYDICPGPACQAYNGFSGEEPLADQAVRETAGLIITYEGKPIDALFTATCGGET